MTDFQSDERKDGGAAFPDEINEGMSLRDYFAGQALIGLALASCIAHAPLAEPDSASIAAYVFADAMLKARAS